MMMNNLLFNFSHGGETAAVFAKNHLMNFIVDQDGFWSKNDDGELLYICI